jgi:hypothetical protein
MVLDFRKASSEERDAKLAAAKGAAVAPLNSVYAEDLHLLPSEIDQFIEDVVAWTDHKYGQDEVKAAREEFFWKMGKVFDDDPFFHERMTLFLDFFVFLRPVSQLAGTDAELTPFVAYKTIHNPGDTETRRSAPVTGVHYSIFEVLKVSDLELTVQDCWSKERYIVRARGDQKFRGITRKDLFQGCLYLRKDDAAISLGCIFHPPESWRVLKKFIKRSMKEAQIDMSKELAGFARINLKALRHPHVNPKRIYSELLNPKQSANSAG